MRWLHCFANMQHCAALLPCSQSRAPGRQLRRMLQHRSAACLTCLTYLSVQLQVRTFGPGDWIVRHGERAARAREVFLITSGEADVLLRNPASRAADANGDIALCRRRAGNFVGALSLHYDGHDSLREPLSPLAVASTGGVSTGGVATSGSPGSAHSSVGTSGFGTSPLPWAPVQLLSRNKRSASAVTAETGNSASARGSRSASSASHSSDASTQPSSAFTATATSEQSCNDTAGAAMRVVMMVLRAARRWVGHRRTVSVRAATQVTAIVLSHEDMRWAVAHDYRMSSELMSALKQRKLSVVRAIRAEKKAAASQ